MKFLTKLGQIINKGLQIASVFVPGINAFLPAGAQATAQSVETKIEDSLQTFSQIIFDVEAIGQVLQLKGADKLKAASPLIADAILKSAAFANHKISDETLFNQGITSLTSGLADVWNSTHPDGIVTVSRKA